MVSALRSAAVLLLGGGLALAQLPTPPATRAAAPASSTPPAGHAARVVYLRGQLEVDADNSSLNQILHDIGRATGMKITGGVADGRVFGTYGPGAPAAILESLLDGAGVNMLLKETATGSPAELILTPRNGPATPPNPADAEDVAAESVPEPSVDRPMMVPGPGGVQTVVRDINGNPVSAAAGVTAPGPAPSPQTPEQLQQQLQQMRQQQQQAMQQRQP